MGRAPAAGTRRDFLSGNDTQPIVCGSTGSWDAPPSLFVQAERGNAEDRRARYTTNAESGASVKTIPGVERQSPSGNQLRRPFYRGRRVLPVQNDSNDEPDAS